MSVAALWRSNVAPISRPRPSLNLPVLDRAPRPWRAISSQPLLLHQHQHLRQSQSQIQLQSRSRSRSFFTQFRSDLSFQSIHTTRRGVLLSEHVGRKFQSSYADPQFQEPTFAQPKRSLAARVIRGTLKYGLGGCLFFLAGVYFALKSLPSNSLSIAHAITERTPTNEETLSLYEPPDERSVQINSHIVSHPLAEELRKDARYIEARPHLKIPEALKKSNLTGGTLAIPGGLAVPPLTFSDKEGIDFVSIFYLGEQLCGHPGLIHGGMLATMLDEGLARCCFNALPNKIGVTAYLKVDYRKPVKAGTFYVLRAKTQLVQGRKAHVKGWIEALDELPSGDVMDGKPGTKLVEAEALYVEPRMAKSLAKFYTDAT